MSKKPTELELDLVIKSTAELSEEVEKDLEKEDRALASLLEEEDED
jgi:hypothetical protein